jgi:Predicted periplasmic ligand-binding sensor domain
MSRKVILAILISATSLLSTVICAPARFSFEKFTYNDKLPSNSVTRIYNDKEGYMWFGTKDGLCRFDGYDTKIFRSSALTPGKLSNNEIRCIAEDNNQQLWIGTYEGINIINKANYSIKHLDNKIIRKELINSILTDSKGFVWIGTSNNGVIKMDAKTGEFEQFTSGNNSRLKLKSNNVTHIYQDKKGQIWVSLWKNGLCYIDKDYKQISYMPRIGTDNNPFRVFQDKSGTYWIGLKGFCLDWDFK